MVAVTEVRTTMVPSADVLPDVLPTERLTATGMAAPELRAELRKIADVRNVGSVLLTWAHPAVTIGAAVDRKSLVEGHSVAVRVDPVGTRVIIIQKTRIPRII